MKIVRHIPNTITSMNLLCGVLGVIFTFNGQVTTAFYMMIAAAVCDFCDGLSARLLHAYSPMGKELDSLADIVSFGVLPSLMSYRLMSETYGESLLCFVPLLIAVFSALRLAKFNIDDRQTENFIGLPTPACALLCGAFAHYVSIDPSSVLYKWASSPLFIPVAACLLSLLLVSEIPMFSMKFKKGMKPGTPIHRQRVGFAGVIFVACLGTFLLGLEWSFAAILIFTSYIVMNIGTALIFRKR